MTYPPDPFDILEEDLPVLRFPDEIRLSHPPRPAALVSSPPEFAASPRSSPPSRSSASMPPHTPLPPSLQTPAGGTALGATDLRQIIPAQELPPPHSLRLPKNPSREIIQPMIEEIEADARRPPRRSFLRRFLIAACFLLLLAGGLLISLLEAGYQTSVGRRQKAEKLQAIQASAIRGYLVDLQKPETMRSSIRVSAAVETLAKALQEFEGKTCKAAKGEDRLSLPRFFGPFVQSSRALYKRLPASWLRAYAGFRQEDKSSPAAPPSSSPASASCEKTASELRSAFSQSVMGWTKQLLVRSERRLEQYAFCQGRFSKTFSDPAFGPAFRRLQTSPCVAACAKPRDPGCPPCLQGLSAEMSLPSEKALDLLRTLAIDRQAQCLQNAGQEPLYAGVFHWGLSIWSRLQVLRMMGILERYQGLSDEWSALRSTIGSRVRLRSYPVGAPIYLVLWSQTLRPAHPLLQKLSKEPIAWADGQDAWLPAIQGVGPKKVVPVGMWMLLHLYDAKTRKRAILPLAPRPGEKIEQTIPLQEIQIHHDARLPIEGLTISEDHRLLAYAARRQLAHDGLAPTTPSCSPPSPVRDLSTPSWRAVVSTFLLDKQGFPQRPSFHLALASELCGIAFFRSTHLLSCEGEAGPPSGEGGKPRAFFNQRPLLTSETSLVFGPPQTLLTTEASKPPRPVSSLASEPTAFQHTCPWENESLRFLPTGSQGQASEVSLASEGLFFDGAKSPQSFAALFHTEGAPPQAFLRFLPWKEGSRPESSVFLPPKNRLPHPFQQIRFSGGRWFVAGGPWGVPLMRWTASSTSEVWAGHPDIRYLSPAYHAPSDRLYSILQWRFHNAGGREQNLTFLVSRRLGSSPP